MKYLLLILSVCLLLGLCACGSADTDEEYNTISGADGETENYTVSPGAVSSANSWNVFFEAYSDRMGEAYEKFYPAVRDSEEYVHYVNDISKLTDGDALLSSVSVFFPKGSMSGESVKMYYQILGYSDIDYVENGSTATLTCKNSSGVPVEYKLQFKDSAALLTVKEDGKLTNVLSVRATEDATAKTYYDLSQNLSVQALYTAQGDVYLCWELSESAKKNELFSDKKLLNDGFATGMENAVSFVGGAVQG